MAVKSKASCKTNGLIQNYKTVMKFFKETVGYYTGLNFPPCTF